eukprot:TRINITY_DN8633_c0_g1_i1.p1 TRINITY_DN8633_c0_g1~~TRINITY_DN8633_c0_g1_i1.p1  ORF type:complete len:453 (+),score=83.27 TRINITY_DN8633_c0_g1_i1:84-1442(+)
MKLFFLAAILVVCIYAQSDAQAPKDCIGTCQTGDKNAIMHNGMMEKKRKAWERCMDAHQCPSPTAKTVSYTPCVNGQAGEYPCSNVDLLSFISLADLGAGGDGNDIWGWTDPQTKHEYAIFGAYDGTSFIDVTDATKPCVVGFLPTHTSASFWRDIKVYKDHAFIVSEANGHGMQVFDLTKLRDYSCVPALTRNVTMLPINKLTETYWYAEFGSSHNIAINEETGYAYSVGSLTCNSGLHVIDINDPTNPTFAGCFADDGYVHDTQCVVYDGPDARYKGKEICFCYNEDTLTIVDVSDKSSMNMLSRVTYPDATYTHQGWLLPGSRYLLLDDELDEIYHEPHTRTMVWDAADLRSPKLVSTFYAKSEVIDHNLYTLGDRAYLANYCGGLRILDTTEAQDGGDLSEVAFFDVSPTCETREFLGSWSNYPYFPSGNIIVSSIERGLFVLKYNRQ